MPNRFTEELAKLQGVNIGAGFILSAQAEMMANQDEATKNTLAIFNKSVQDLDGELKTTSEQLQEIANSNVFEQGVEDIEKMSAQYQAMLDASLMQQQKYQEAYQESIRDLISIGSPESIQQANALEKELPFRLQNLKDRMAIPFERLNFKKSMFELNRLKLDTETADITLRQLKQDINVMDLVTKMMAVEIPGTEGETYWADLVSNMGRNLNTGKVNFKERQDTFYQMINNELAGNPLKDKVIQVLDLEMSKRVYNYDPPVQQGNGGFERLQDDANYTLGLYQFLKDATKGSWHFEHDKDYAGTRKLYSDYADAYIQEAGITDINAISNIKRFGSSKEVIKRIKQSNAGDNYLTAVRSDGLVTDHLDVLDTIHSWKYDKDSPSYYWGNLETFKKKINRGETFKIVPYVEMGTNETGGKLYGRNVRNVPIMNKMIPFDLTALMSNDSGYWEYYEPSITGHPESMEEFLYKNIPDPNRPKVPSQINEFSNSSKLKMFR